MLQSAPAAQARADDRVAPVPRLSTDYLNRFAEALMLIEMAPADPAIVEDLRNWRLVGYAEHFAVSKLRCAAEAAAAYAALPAEGRAALDGLCRAMGRLVVTVTALIGEGAGQGDIGPVVEVAGEALRRLIARANRFINANGALDAEPVDEAELQATIDALFA